MTFDVVAPGRLALARTVALATTAPARPGVVGALVSQVLAGVLAATIPTALQARTRGAGLGVALAGVAGAAMGIGDAARRGSTVWTHPEQLAMPWPVLVVSVSLVMVVLALPPTRGVWERGGLELTPFAPAWALAYSGDSYRLALGATVAQLRWVAGGWGLVSAVLLVVGARSGRPPR